MEKGIAVAAAWLLALSSLAFAHEQARIDDDDSPGPLDIVVARQTHRVLQQASLHPPRSRRVTEIRHRIVTYEEWRSELLTGNKNFMAIEFNFDDDAAIERCIVITHGEHEPRARLYRNCKYSNDRLERALSAHRPDRHSMVVAVDRHHLKKGIDAYRWRAVTSFEDRSASEGDPCWPGTFPPRGRYGVCADTTEWRRHSF